MPVPLVSRLLLAGVFWVCPLAAQNDPQAQSDAGQQGPGVEPNLAEAEIERAPGGVAQTSEAGTLAPRDELTATPASESPAPGDDVAERSVPSPRLARGRELRAQGDLEGALQEFTAERAESVGKPEGAVALFEMAQCYEKLGRYDDAIAAYRGYLTEGVPGSAEASAAQAAVQRLEASLVQVHLSVGVKGSGPLFNYQVWIDGRLVGQDARTLHLPAGSHVLEVRTTGFEPAKQTVVVAQGAPLSLSLEMTPQAQEYDGLHPAYFWTGVSLTAATALTGSLFGLAALGASSGVNQSLAAGPPASLEVTEADRTKIDHLATTADVFFISSGVLAAGTVALAFFTDFHRNKPRQEHSSVQAHFLPGGGGLTVRGTF